MRHGYLGFRWEASPAYDLGRPCFGALALPLPFPFLLLLEDLSIIVDWIARTYEVLTRPDELQEDSLGAMLETNFCLEEDFAGV